MKTVEDTLFTASPRSVLVASVLGLDNWHHQTHSE